MPTWRCRRGRATWKTRSRACSTTTIPCFAAAAVHFIVQRRLWALTGDIEYRARAPIGGWPRRRRSGIVGADDPRAGSPRRMSR